MNPRMIIAMIVTTVLAFPCIAVTSAYRDVLETPALKSPLAAKNLLTGVTLAGERLVCVGQYGHILYSDDHGKNWTQAEVPVSSDLTAVHFPSPLKGWAVGHDGVVLKSEDGGATWSKLFDGRAAAQVMVGHYKASKECSTCHGPTNQPPAAKPTGANACLMEDMKRYIEQGADKPFLDVWFENDTQGFVVGAFNHIFRTTDGGKSWEPWFGRINNPKRFHLFAMRGIGQDLFITGEQGTVWKLDRQVGRFQEIKTPYNGTFFGITGKPGSLIAFGLRGNAFRSQNGGANWQKVETGIKVSVTGGTVMDDGRLVLVGQGGQVAMSTDNGASFTPVKVDQVMPIAAVVAPDRDTLVLAGLNGVRVQPIK